MDSGMDATNPQARLEQKIDALADNVAAGFAAVDKRFTGVETRLDSVETRLDGVRTQLTEIDERLTRVEILAKDTNTLCKNIWDSKTSLERQMDEGFKEAKKDSDEKCDVVHKAILHWGDKVKVLEPARTRRATKRRR